MSDRTQAPCDVIVVGAGAAGLAAGIFLKRAQPDRQVIVLDGARRPGAKILVSGGGRCNVTNREVRTDDFNGGRPGTIRRVLGALPVADTIRFFRELGVPLHEEAGGKLFPDSNQSRDVLDALTGGLREAGGQLRAGCRVEDVSPAPEGFALATSAGPLTARTVVLTTGGLALPKSGSDGAGYRFATRFGHTIVPTTPALVPLVSGEEMPPWMQGLRGVSQPVRLTVSGPPKPRHVEGSLLWTHFGVSGPAALDASRHWLRARLDGQSPSMVANLVPIHGFETLEAWWLEQAQRQPRSTAANLAGRIMPAAVADAIAAHVGLRATPLANVTREERRRLLHHLISAPIPVADSRGYQFAEVTAGGVPLSEVDPATMESRLVRGLYFAGEILDVDGRLGGFNFQWAWSSAKAVGEGLRCNLTA